MRGSHLSGQGMATKRFSLFLLRLRASDAARAAQTDDFFKERRQANHVHACVRFAELKVEVIRFAIAFKNL